MCGKNHNFNAEFVAIPLSLFNLFYAIINHLSSPLVVVAAIPLVRASVNRGFRLAFRGVVVGDAIAALLTATDD